MTTSKPAGRAMTDRELERAIEAERRLNGAERRRLERELEDGHAEHDTPREGCPACRGRR